MWLLLAASWESVPLKTCDMHMHLRKYWSVLLVCSVDSPGQEATVCYHQKLCSDQPAQMNSLIWLDLSQIIFKVYFVKILPRYSWINNANTDLTTFIILWKNLQTNKTYGSSLTRAVSRQHSSHRCRLANAKQIIHKAWPIDWFIRTNLSN